ncbi:MAG: hypothetical protein F6K11_25825 [Leptolyngbya sp. SIO3F4]|nr:hypothetical protein [Leptolyngbya sp. SIO3F4]
MNKQRQTRQSAVTDFMQSLEQLDELLGDALSGDKPEKAVLDDIYPVAETKNVTALPLDSSKLQATKTNQPNAQ